MDRRNLGAGLVALVCCMCLFGGTAMARGTAAAVEGGQCTVKTLPSFTAQGEFSTTATVADVIEIGCDPTEYGTGSEITVIDSQLYNRCGNEMSWYIPNPYDVIPDSNKVNLKLDADGNATVALIAGPQCQAGETLVTVHETNEPFESFTASFSVLAPNDTEEGVFAMPSSQIEDAESSAVATIVEAEFPGKSESKVRFGSEELYARCKNYPHLHWITEDGYEYTDQSLEWNGGEITGLELDNNGNVFALAIGDSSCFPGTSLIEADLETKPFTTLTTGFTIESPKPRD